MKARLKSWTQCFFAGILPVLFSCVPASAELTLAVADSTCSAMKEAGAVFTRQTGIQLKYECQASGLLVKGIKEKAIGADYFLAASRRWMDDVVDAGLVDSKNIQAYIRNQLVVAYFPSKKGDFGLTQMSDLLSPSVHKIIIGNPDVAPVGSYARQALVNARIWSAVQPKIKLNQKISLSIRSLKKLSLASPGIVAFLYKTNVSNKMRIHFSVPQELYPKIQYYSAPLLHTGKKDEISKWLQFLRSTEARVIFTTAGFMINEQ